MMMCNLHVYKGLGVGKGVGELDFAEDVAVAVDGRVAGCNDGAIDVQSVSYVGVYCEDGCPEEGCEGEEGRHCVGPFGCLVVSAEKVKGAISQ